MIGMKSLLRICLTVLLVLQVIALPLHTFAEEVQHLAGSVGHHHHSHSDIAADVHAHDSAADPASASSESYADSGEYGCISHCHVPAALLDDVMLFKHLSAQFATVSEHFGFARNLPETIDRPQWSAARV